MTDDDLILAVVHARDRLRRHGRFMLAPTTIAVSGEPLLPTTVDGEMAILHFSPDKPDEIVSFPVDRTLTLGQFIDGFNTTMAVLYGPMQSQVTLHGAGHTHTVSHGAQSYQAGIIGVPALGHQVTPWHEAVFEQSQAIDWSSDELTFLGKPLNTLSPTEVKAAQEIVRHMKEKPSMVARFKDLFK